MLPVPMMNVLNGGAHADNTVDFQEFMVVPGRRVDVRRGAAHGRRGLPRAQEDAARARARHRGRRRGRLRARPRVQRGGAAGADRGHRGGRLPPGDDVAIALDPATSEIFSDGALRAQARGPHADVRRARRLLGRPGRPLPDPLDRGRDGRGGLGRLEGAHRPDRRPRAARRRRPVRHQHRAPEARHRPRRRRTRS